MEIIIPMAGMGKRMRPHTFNKPKPLIQVAGKPMLQHIIDRVLPLKPTKIHFIIGGFKEQVDEFIAQGCPVCSTVETQEIPNGDGGAILLAKKHVDPDSDVLVIFSDTIFEADFEELKGAPLDYNVVWTQTVEDPSRFGVVFLDGEKVTKFIEKPKEPVSNLALIGMYYVRSAKMMFEELEKNNRNKIQSAGEYRLIDALANMIEMGETIKTGKVTAWLDCGTLESILDTNRVLLKKMHNTVPAENTVFIEPVYIAKGAKISNSVIGPHVSVGPNTVIENSIIKDSIIGNESNISQAQIAGSLVGSEAVVEGRFKQMNVGENSQLISKEL